MTRRSHKNNDSTMNGENWKQFGWATALFFPSIVSIITFALNFFVWGQRSSGAVPFTTVHCASLEGH